MTRSHVFVSGVVQGVFYRASAYERATQLGLAGWVRNLPDGRVEAVFEGPDEKVERMLAWCREGTPFSRVDEVSVETEEPEDLEGFRISD